MVDDIQGPKRGSSAMDDDKSIDEEMSFVPPEKIAEEEEVIDMTKAGQELQKPNPKVKGPKKTGKLAVWWSNFTAWWASRSKKQKIIISAVGALVIILVAAGGVLALHKKPMPKPAPVAQKKEEKKATPKSTTEASRLTGAQISPELNQIPITGIMIENSPDARPQSGLDQAGVVFEAVAEGGITRFLTLWQETQPDYVGPVRSVRPYYLQWLQGFDASIAHVGGSPEALAKIQTDGIKDLDQFYNGGPYQRITERYAPHNVYTSLGGLLALEKSKGFTSSSFTGFARKAEKASATPTAKTIDFSISGPLYNAHYDYDAASNSYLRSEGGLPHKDERSGKQLNPKVVIALVLPQGLDPDGIHTTYNTLGNGTAYIFQDGIVTQGTWSKASDKEQFRFGDANGSPLGLNAGQTWLSAVGATSDVVYKP